ncbi:Tyrosyl-tRNA synthetase [Hordeum vulgare]|nr:Tyrosyl-tRNA synthetase [Hordeum vulgare]
MKFHFVMGLNNDIAKSIFTNTYKSLDDIYFGALKAEQELKGKATRHRAHFGTTKLHDYEHEDDGVATKTMESLKEHALEASNNVASMVDASILGGEIDDVPSSAFIHGDGHDMVEHRIFPSITTMFAYELNG